MYFGMKGEKGAMVSRRMRAKYSQQDEGKDENLPIKSCNYTERAMQLAKEFEIGYRTKEGDQFVCHSAFSNHKNEPVSLDLSVYRILHYNPGLKTGKLVEKTGADEQAVRHSLHRLEACEMILSNNLNDGALTEKGNEFYQLLADEFGWPKERPQYKIRYSDILPSLFFVDIKHKQRGGD